MITITAPFCNLLFDLASGIRPAMAGFACPIPSYRSSPHLTVATGLLRHSCSTPSDGQALQAWPFLAHVVFSPKTAVGVISQQHWQHPRRNHPAADAIDDPIVEPRARPLRGHQSAASLLTHISSLLSPIP